MRKDAMRILEMTEQINIMSKELSVVTKERDQLRVKLGEFEERQQQLDEQDGSSSGEPEQPKKRWWQS